MEKSRRLPRVKPSSDALDDTDPLTEYISIKEKAMLDLLLSDAKAEVFRASVRVLLRAASRSLRQAG